uniref:(northern house mosquito) hypothetical protein n=1 Tax=Culex pipiens TaxID=7175 RepID=A0A8D8JSH2_CULPI
MKQRHTEGTSNRVKHSKTNCLFPLVNFLQLFRLRKVFFPLPFRYVLVSVCFLTLKKRVSLRSGRFKQKKRGDVAARKWRDKMASIFCLKFPDFFLFVTF